MVVSTKGFASLSRAAWVLCLSFPVCAQAAVSSRKSATPQPSPRSLSSDKKESGLKWLPPTAQAQQETAAYLKVKAGRDVPIPPIPANDLLGWFFARHRVQMDTQKTYVLAFEDFLIAQKLLEDHDPTSRRKGLRLALYSSLWIKERLHDFKLREGFFDALLLPNLDAAYAQSWKDLSRQSILERACAAYRENKSTDKLIAALKQVVEIADSQNAADWARIKLCETLDAQQKYAEAIRYLNQVHSPEMSGSKTWVVELQQKLEKQKLEPQKLEPQKLEPQKLEPQKLEPQKSQEKNSRKKDAP